MLGAPFPARMRCIFLGLYSAFEVAIATWLIKSECGPDGTVMEDRKLRFHVWDNGWQYSGMAPTITRKRSILARFYMA